MQIDRYASRWASWAWWARAMLVPLISGAATGRVDAQLSPEFCGPLSNSYGPFEYRYDRFKPAPGDTEPYHRKLALTEDYHFSPAVESLIRGVSSVTPHIDIDYTLRVFPNHHRALAALSRLWERTKSPQPGALPRPVECYFERAVRFQPDDTIVRLLYATFLHKDNRRLDALSQLENALHYAQNNAFTYYNIGLVYLDVGEHARALAMAHRAIALGFTRVELKNRLVALGKWQEPTTERPLGQEFPSNPAK